MVGSGSGPDTSLQPLLIAQIGSCDSMRQRAMVGGEEMQLVVGEMRAT